MRAYDEIVSRYGDIGDANVRPVVALAELNRTVVAGEPGDAERALRGIDEVERRYESRCTRPDTSSTSGDVAVREGVRVPSHGNRMIGRDCRKALGRSTLNSTTFEAKTLNTSSKTSSYTARRRTLTPPVAILRFLPEFDALAWVATPNGVA